MVCCLTSDQVLVHHRDSKNIEKDDANNRDNPDYDISIDKIQDIENGDNNSSKPNQILCSICKRSDKIVTDPESGVIICSNCGMILADKVEDASHSERRIFSGGQINDKS